MFNFCIQKEEEEPSLCLILRRTSHGFLMCGEQCLQIQADAYERQHFHHDFTLSVI
jgi:hypothetical protein